MRLQKFLKKLPRLLLKGCYLLVLFTCWGTEDLLVLAQQQKVDLNNPESVLKSYRKIFCSLVDGEPVIYWWQGQVYSRTPGEKDRQLFQIQGMNIRAGVTKINENFDYGYRIVSREVMLYLHPETGEILRSWQNPWTNKKVVVFHVANDPVNGRPQFVHPNLKFEGTLKNEQVLISRVIPLFYSNPLGGNYQDYIGGNYHAMEIFNFFVPQSQLLDPSLDRIPNVNIAWTRISPWLPWMEMGARVGLLIFQGAGMRLNSWNELPLILQTEIEARYPQFRNPPPLNDSRPNQTSWTNFKLQIDSLPEPSPDN